VFVITIVVLIAGAIAYLQLADTLPDVNTERRPRSPRALESGNPSTPGDPDIELDIFEDPAIVDTRNTDKFTFLILATDLGDALTDVIMVATFDRSDYSMNVVSIPRDTLVNVSWPVKKANSIYANMRHQHRNEQDRDTRRELIMDSTIDHFANLLGFPVDFWVLVDTRAFIRLVDAIGGVEFDIPVRMTHEEFLRAYSPGPQQLTGREALDVVRFRGFGSGDIGRIGTQQSFLETAVRQILEQSESIRYRDIISIFLNYVETDLTLLNLIGFAQLFLRMDAENINFATLPGDYNAWLVGGSYVTIYVDEWLEMVNELLNPWYEDITVEDVSILTRGPDRRLFVTDGNFAGNPNWGQPGSGGGRTPANNAPTTPTTPDGNQPTDPPDAEEGNEAPNANQPDVPAYGEDPPGSTETPDEIPPQIPDEAPPPPEPQPTDPPPESDA